MVKCHFCKESGVEQEIVRFSFDTTDAATAGLSHNFCFYGYMCPNDMEPSHLAERCLGCGREATRVALRDSKFSFYQDCCGRADCPLFQEIEAGKAAK